MSANTLVYHIMVMYLYAMTPQALQNRARMHPSMQRQHGSKRALPAVLLKVSNSQTRELQRESGQCVERP